MNKVVNKLEIEICQNGQEYWVDLLLNGKAVKAFGPLASLDLARLQANDLARKLATLEEKLLLSEDQFPSSGSEIPGWLQ